MIFINITNECQEILPVLLASSHNQHPQTRHTLTNLQNQAGHLRREIEAFANDSNVFRGAVTQANLSSTQIDTGNALFSILLDAVGFVPDKVGTASGVIGSVINVIDIIAGLTDDRAVQEYLARMYALGNSVLGSGVIAIQTPNGFHIVATSHNNPNMAINVAGLGELGISVADVSYAWMHGNQEVQDSVNHFLDVNSPERRDFMRRLTDVFDKYMESGRLVELFGSTHPNLSSARIPEQLPHEVLAYLLSVMEGRP